MQRGFVLSSSCLSLVLMMGQVVIADQPQPEFGVSATFSIVAVDPETGQCGAAVASKYPSVGKVVPYVRAGVGAFCTQHWHHPPWGEVTLDLLEEGHKPEQVLALLLENDPRRDKRQLAIIDMAGRSASHDPADADENGQYWGSMSGRYYACQGNTLTGREVIAAMAEAYEETDGSLADRMLAALLAGDCAGGDHRGRLAAGIRVATTGQQGNWLELDIDESDDAVQDLVRAYQALDHPGKGAWGNQTTPHRCAEPAEPVILPSDRVISIEHQPLQPIPQTCCPRPPRPPRRPLMGRCVGRFR